jgi:cell division protein FtsN
LIFMIVICPKCQFENKAETTHVVCARCATLIETGSAQGTVSTPGWLTDELPPRITRPMSNGPTSGAAPRRDPYATRIEPEADEVLDIPRVNNGVFPVAEAGSLFDDVLSAPPAASPVIEPVATTPAYDDLLSESFSPQPAENLNEYQQEEILSDQYATQFTEEYSPAPYTDSPFTRLEEEPAPVVSEQPSAIPAGWPELTPQNGAPVQNRAWDASGQSWPLLPEDSFSAPTGQDGPLFSAPARGGMLTRVLLGILAFVALGALAWYFFGDRFAKQDQLAAKPNNPLTASNAPPGAATGAANNAAVKPGSENNAKTAGSPATSPGAKPAAAQTSPATAKSSPLPVPMNSTAPTGPSGQSVSRNEGSLALQIGSFNNQNEATQKAAALKSAGIDVRVIKAEIPGRGTWHRLQAGRFTSNEEAARFASQLKARGLIKEFFVTGYQAN